MRTHTQAHKTKDQNHFTAFPLVKKLWGIKIGTFWIRSSALPVRKVSFPLSSTVAAESFSKVTPAANGCPGLLQNGG
jgi:hypothetical protein